MKDMKIRSLKQCNFSFYIKVIIMKKFISLALVFSLFVSNSTIFATGANDSVKKYSNFFALVKAMFGASVILGAFAGVKVAAEEAKKLESKNKEFAAKTAIGVSGVFVGAASLIFSVNNMEELLFPVSRQKNNSFVYGFCLILNAANIIASLYELKHIVSGQVFSGKSLKVNIGL